MDVWRLWLYIWAGVLFAVLLTVGIGLFVQFAFNPLGLQ